MRSPALIYAGRTERFFAFLLDQLIVTLLQLALFSTLSDGLAIFSAFACEAAYYSLMMSSTWQATIGQRLLSMYVIKRNGSPITPAAALERFLAYFLPLLPLYTSTLPDNLSQPLAGGLMMFWFLPILLTEERAGMHDQLCNTRVVVGRPENRT